MLQNFLKLTSCFTHHKRQYKTERKKSIIVKLADSLGIQCIIGFLEESLVSSTESLKASMQWSSTQLIEIFDNEFYMIILRNLKTYQIRICLFIGQSFHFGIQFCLYLVSPFHNTLHIKTQGWNKLHFGLTIFV